MKKSITTFFLLSILCAAANAQPYMNPSMISTGEKTRKTTFWDVQQSFEKYWSTREVSEVEGENAEEGGYQQFKRWEWFVKQRTFPSGNFYHPEALYKEYLDYKPAFETQRQSFTANWSYIGPFQVPGNGGGAGRINCLTFDPTNSNILWIGAACGGLWKSTDGGLTWSSNTDLLPSLSISDIIIDPANTNIMYIATGDKYGIYYQYEVIGHYSAGVLKSTDGGATWNQTGLNYDQANITIIQRLIMSPLNNNMLYAATNNGIFLSNDAGLTWTSQLPGQFYDIEMCPSNPDILYCGDSIQLYKTINAGGLWTPVPAINSNGRTSIAVTPADSSVVYVWAVGGGFYYSNNFGATFTTRDNPSGEAGPYGHYDYVLEVSPVNTNILFAGGLNVARSTNGGNSWTTVSDWAGWPNSNYSHADNHDLKFEPGSSQIIYSLNDGGIFKSSDQGNTWIDLSNGLDIKQFYRMGSSALTPTLIYGGSQDNGTDRMTGATSEQVYGADGEECLVDWTDDNVVFISTQGGNFLKSTDGGVNFNNISGYGQDWTSPIIMDPNDHNIMYLGNSSVMKSTDVGDSWNTISGSLDGSAIYSLEVSFSDPNTVYAATFGSIHRTTNGTTWNNITGSLPVNNAAITGIAISDTDKDVAWITFSGYSSGEKVFMTDNGGASWINVSGTLPNIPVNCIEYQNYSNDILYIGTDFGVFYQDGTMNDWLPYNTGMPNVIIDELEVYYTTSKLRAATFGRGLWESDLQVSTLLALDCGVSGILSPSGNTCDTNFTPVVRVRNYGIDTLTSFQLHYHLDAQPTQVYAWTGSLPSQTHVDISLPGFSLSGGTHNYFAYTTDPNTQPDMNPSNDDRFSTFTILSNPASILAPVIQGFDTSLFPPPGWNLENSSGIWSRSTNAGGWGLSAESARSNFWSVLSGDDKIISAYINFAGLEPPITLTFDVAYAQYSTTYHDSLIVDLYSDCDAAGTRIYAKGDALLATAPLTSSIFIPTASQWRTESINLDSWAGSLPLEMRFIGKSGYGNDLYLDNINLTANIVGIGETNILENYSRIYPNPSTGSIYVEVSGTRTGELSIFVTDLTGQLVKEINDKAFSGYNKYSLDLSALAGGIYFVKTVTQNISSTEKVNIMK